MIKLLLVEDDANLSYIIQGGLEDMIGGYEVIIACNGKEGLEKYRQVKPDIIVADIEMPVMDGYEATAAMRALPRQDAVRIPILALTANAFVTDVGKAKNAGMNDHITKPINLEVLFATLYKWLV